MPPDVMTACVVEPPVQVYVLAELVLIGIACLVSAFVGAGVVWWRMTAPRPRHQEP